jgi:hypothetical protein
MKQSNNGYVLWIMKCMPILTHSQLLEGLKCESQTENNERAKSRGTLLGSQHYRKVQGRARAPGWD